MNYAFVIFADLLFALQFLFNQQFRKRNSDGIDSTFTFSMYTNGISFVILMIINLVQFRAFTLDITPFSLAMAFVYALVLIAYSYSGLKAFATANLSVYSIFAMLGGMLLPFAYGVIFRNEDFSFFKAVCIVLIVVATALSFEKGKKTKGNFKYYLAVFILNGLVGVISTVHSKTEAFTAVDSGSFMATVNLFAFAICVIFHLVRNKKIPLLPIKEVGNLTCYAACSGIGNFLCLIALDLLPASVQYPITTGGVMVFSTVISIIRKEKPSAKTVISTVIAFAATVLIML